MKDRIILIIFVGTVALLCAAMSRITFDALQQERAELAAIALEQSELRDAVVRLHRAVQAQQADVTMIRGMVFLHQTK